MKKIFTFILAVLICISAFSACGKTEQEATQLTTTQQTTTQPTTSQKPVIGNDTPDWYYIYNLNSYDEIVQALTVENTDWFEKLRAEQEEWGKVYCDTLSAFASGDIKLAIPQFDGSNMKLRENERLPIISFMTSELFDLPWIWYHCIVDDYYFRVKISYPSILGNEEINSATSYNEVKPIIAPDLWNPNNLNRDDCKAVYEKEIVFADGSKHIAFITERNDRPWMYIIFCYDGMIIKLSGDSELFTDDFWSSFSMAQYDATQDDTSVELTEKA